MDPQQAATVKKCSTCGIVKNISEFHKAVRKDRPTGKKFKYASKCKECFNRKTREIYHSGIKRIETRKAYVATSVGKAIAVRSSVKHYESISGRACHLFNGAKKRADNWECFDITREFLEAKLRNGHCEITGIPFDMRPIGVASKKNPYAPSIDRIDNTKGYIQSNVRMVLWAVNLMHGEMTDSQLIDMCKAVLKGFNKMNDRDWIYDLETFPNIFTATFIHAATGLEQVFEISDRRNDYDALNRFVTGLSVARARGVGFNSIGFDYPVLHWIMANQGCTVDQIYDKAMSIIRSSDKFGSIIWESDHLFQQLDLFKIWHYDNKAKSTSLKALEIAMCSKNIVDLPFPVGTMLNDAQKDVLIAYNKHDVRETLKFYGHSQAQIALRESLSEKYQRNMLNYSNTKIGSTILITQMEAAGIQCYMQTASGKAPRQTVRASINLGEVVFPYVKFERPEFQRVLDFFKSTTITETKGTFADLESVVDGFAFVFGTGGIHGSVESQIVYTDDTYQIVDVDVTSFYPRMAIVNGMYPEHLGEAYCGIYNDIFEQRKSYGKGTPENAALKEALNASYGNSNNAFSPLRDSKYTMQTTINGQLLLCMLAEQLIKIPGLTMVQANTDGLTVRCPRVHLDHMRTACKWWEGLTGLQLEEVLYKRMMIRDVNNYIAESMDGKLKRKGAYEYNMQWHQDPSALVVPKAAEAALVRGESIREFIVNHHDPFDFMCRAKVPRDSTLELRWPEWSIATQMQGTTRYFVSRNGGQIVKVSPPTGEPGTWKRKNGITDEFFRSVMREIAGQPGQLDAAGTPHDVRIHTGNKSQHVTRELSLCAGWRVSECADADHFDWGDLNYEWYIAEAEKLVKPLTGAS